MRRTPIRPPEWMYQVTPIADIRTDDVRFQDLTTARLHPRPRTARARHRAAATGRLDRPPAGSSPTGPTAPRPRCTPRTSRERVVTRKLVFFNNIGVVTFARADDSSLTAQMAVYFQRPHAVSDDEKPHPYVVHAASLTAVPLVAPTTVGGS